MICCLCCSLVSLSICIVTFCLPTLYTNHGKIESDKRFYVFFSHKFLMFYVLCGVWVNNNDARDIFLLKKYSFYDFAFTILTERAKNEKRLSIKDNKPDNFALIIWTRIIRLLAEYCSEK